MLTYVSFYRLFYGYAGLLNLSETHCAACHEYEWMNARIQPVVKPCT